MAPPLAALGTKVLWAVPMTSLRFDAHSHADISVIGDRDGRPKRWFGDTTGAAVRLRPDRLAALSCGPQLV